MQDVEKVVRTLQRGMDFQACVQLAVEYFHQYFRDFVRDLVRTHPADATNSDGTPFWSAGRRFPRESALDPSNDDHLNFILTTANILAACFGLVPPPEKELLPAVSGATAFSRPPPSSHLPDTPSPYPLPVIPSLNLLVLPWQTHKWRDPAFIRDCISQCSIPEYQAGAMEVEEGEGKEEKPKKKVNAA